MTTAFQSADILLPKENIDMAKWAVIACDQYTSEPEYWNKTENYVGTAPSTLNLILPEVYLKEEQPKERLKTIHAHMMDYEKSKFFTKYENAMIYLERTTSTGQLRAGLVGKLDLEEYDFFKGSNSQVRATEATVIDRLPPRVKIRRGALLELSHVMLLIDDEKQAVIEPLHTKVDSLEKLYDFELMNGGGSVKGYLLGEAEKRAVTEALCQLCDPDEFHRKYDTTSDSVFVYAIGDGNHSLAAAKQYYEGLKLANPDKDFSNHPARYALVELINLHSPALHFEAIHRIVTDVNTDDLMKKLTAALGLQETGDGQRLRIILNGTEKDVVITKPSAKITVGSLQDFLDTYLQENGGEIDYIHGLDSLRQLAAQPDSIGFALPDMRKDDLFSAVIADGALPRKTFSTGHAQDKRYYLECRKIAE